MAVLSGGASLNAKLDALRKKIANPATLRVGFLQDENARYPDGTPVATVAYIQEFGAGPIPPRPFFRTMIAEKHETWANNIVGRLRAHDWDAAKALDELGALVIAPQLTESIKSLQSPPLSPVTLMLRRMLRDDPSLTITGATVGEAARKVANGESYAGVSTKPLIRPGEIGGGNLLRSVASEVVAS